MKSCSTTNGVSRLLWNFDAYLPDGMPLHPRRQSWSCLWLFKLRDSLVRRFDRAVFFSHSRHYGSKAVAEWSTFFCMHAHYASSNCIIKKVYLIQSSFLSCCVHFALVCVLAASLCLPFFRIFLYIVPSFYLHLFVLSW